ncbi:nitrate- and nitrite sensing domain-containing protein [Streptomyces sp. BI20]|uniref:sensor histidine kinase n=1 Tax=Streptomyces sp. BI20 TaxID=3403460 RepID=UPI003C72F528
MRRSNASTAEEPARGNFTPPQRAAVPGPGAPDPQPAPSAGSGSRFSPRNWRVPTRLNAILLLPVLVGLVMGGFQVKGSVDTWNEAKDAEKTARIVQAAAAYGEALLNERDLTAAPLLAGKREDPAVAKAYAATDAAKTAFDRSLVGMPTGQGLERRLELFRQEEPKLAKLRESAYLAQPETAKKKLPAAAGPVPTEEGYVLVQHYLMQFANELGLGTGNVTSYGRMVYALQLAKAAGSLQRSIGTHLLVRPSEDDDVRKSQLVAFSSYAYLEEIAVGEYVAAGTQADTDRLVEVMSKRSQEGAARLAEAQKQARDAGKTLKAPPTVDGSPLQGMTEAIASGAKPTALAEGGTTAPAWNAAATAKFEGYAEIEKELLDKALADAVAVSDEARNDAILTGAIVVIALTVAFLLAAMVARQMGRSMRRLRGAAFEVAEQRLPGLVDQLSRTDPGKVDTRVAPIPITSRDEIGEIARAFDQVHREAVRLAAEQALLRGNVNAIFTNLSIRNQSLIEGQLTLITDLENNEADPDQLENLFRLDHLATRMRRNGENLLILAGEEPGRRWDQPVPLVDVLRAASSEVEQYERIELSGVSEAEIHGRAVTDLVHLLAELLENATTFSSPQTKVRVNATRLPDGRVMIEIHDKGIGLTAADFADINNKLADPPTVDAAVSQRMGLFVVGRLADRHNIRVQLRPSGEQAAGTTSLVMLPEVITHGGGGEQVPEGDFTVSSIIPAQAPGPFGGAPTGPAGHAPTAAELGFDDSRYQGEADAVQRSLTHQERRAALEAQVGRQSPEQPQEHGWQPERTGEQPAPQHGAPGEFGTGQGQFGQQQAGWEQPWQPEGTGTHPAPVAPDWQQPHTPAQPFPALEQQPSFPPEAPAAPLPGALEQQDFGQGWNAPAPENSPSPWPGYAPAVEPGYGDGWQPAYDNGPGADAGRSHPVEGWQDPSSGTPGTPGTEQVYEVAGQSFPASGQWPDQNPVPASYQHNHGTESESPVAPEPAPERVGFDRPDTTDDTGHQLTGAGLPRRGSRSQWQPAQQEAESPKSFFEGRKVQPAESEAEEDGNGWRSRNDERWAQAGKLREPKAGGVTPSGLPRRVPKANLVEGTAESTPQGGPSVSRAPEDVRGRLSNLRRGVQQGRSAGSEQSSTSYDQER